MDSKQTGWQHFAEADWAAARDAFAAALDSRPATPRRWTGWASRCGGWASATPASSAAARRTPRTGAAATPASAGRLATYLAGEHRIDGRTRPPPGWLSRARRLLADSGPGRRAGLAGDRGGQAGRRPRGGRAHARAALDDRARAGRRRRRVHGACRSSAAPWCCQGRVEEGVALLDEAMTVALGGESSDPLACGDACCTTLVVCDGLADLQRATQWCEAVVEFTERRRFMPVQSWCRAIYGGVLVRAGDWERAEAVLSEALARQAEPAQGRRPRAAAGRAGRPAAAAGPARGGRAAAERGSRTSRLRSRRSCGCTWSAATWRSRGRCSTARGGRRRRRALVLRGDAGAGGGRAADAAAARGASACGRGAAAAGRDGPRRREADRAGGAAWPPTRRRDRRRAAERAARGRGRAASPRSRFPLEEARARLALARVQAADGLAARARLRPRRPRRLRAARRAPRRRPRPRRCCASSASPGRAVAARRARRR